MGAQDFQFKIVKHIGSARMVVPFRSRVEMHFLPDPHKIMWSKRSFMLYTNFTENLKKGRTFYKGDILCVLYSTLLHLPHLRFHCLASVDTGIEPRAVATLALAVRRSNLSDRFRPLSVKILDHIHSLYGNKILL